jgi:uncharacterized protein
MVLRDQIQQDLLQSMKDKDEVKTAALRMLKAAIMKFEVSGSSKKEATDDEVIALVNKEAKQRKDSIESFRNGGREEMAAQEEAELKILQTYLPEQLSEEDLRKIVEGVIEQTGATSKADIGKVMGAVMPKVKGLADGGMINKLVGELLD